MKEERSRFIFIVVLVLLATYIVVPFSGKWPDFVSRAKMKLGIDLAGGAELTYRVLFPPEFKGDRGRVTNEVLAVLLKRIDRRGLKEPKINVQDKDQIIIQLPGVDRQELENFKKLLKTVGKLELRAVATQEVHEKYNASKKVPAGYGAYKPAISYSTPYEQIKEHILGKKEGGITGKEVSNAQAQIDIGQLGGQANFKVLFTLNDNGKADFNKMAARLFKQEPKGMIAIILDGKIQSAPVVQSDSFPGGGEITGSFTEDEAKDLSIILKSGSLPYPIGRVDDGKLIRGVPEAENFVGPTLGQDSIRRGVTALAVAGGVVALFIILYYLGGGIIAVLTLLFNLLFLTAILSFFGATLTLPGIAGIILTVGMAVDANILIFERVREEMRKGKTAVQAYEAGHERAFSAILDANVTTLIAAAVLYWFGTGPVKGFAVTLSIGILTTMFSVLYCGKSFLKLLVSGGSIKQFKMLNFIGETKIKFTSGMRIAAVVSVILVGLSITFFATSGDRKWGLDFTGGTILNFGFRADESIDTVRNAVTDIKDEGSGLPRYADAQIQILSPPGGGLGDVAGIGRTTSRHFSLRTGHQDKNQVRNDIQDAFSGKLSHQPFGDVPKDKLPKNPRIVVDTKAGAGLYLYMEGEGLNLKDLEKVIATDLDSLVSNASVGDRPRIVLVPAEGVKAPKGMTVGMLLFAEQDSSANDALIEEAQRKLKSLSAAGQVPLSADPFSYEGNIGPAVAEELKNTTIIALIISWVLMIGYIAIRFYSWKFGMAAVVALVHDALITVGFICLCVIAVPKAMGLSFDMNLTTVAALLTIVGYSVNDTIVTFDRIRENLVLMKKDSFTDIVNASINQTLPRTVLTSVTTWVTVTILYFLTMQSAGGIASFAFPLVVGLIVGTYSSMFIAAPIVVAWFKDSKPVVTK